MEVARPASAATRSLRPGEPLPAGWPRSPPYGPLNAPRDQARTGIRPVVGSVHRACANGVEQPDGARDGDQPPRSRRRQASTDAAGSRCARAAARRARSRCSGFGAGPAVRATASRGRLAAGQVDVRDRTTHTPRRRPGARPHARVRRLARRICAPRTPAVTRAIPGRSRRRGASGIVDARTRSATSSASPASGRGSTLIRNASRRVSDGPPASS